VQYWDDGEQQCGSARQEQGRVHLQQGTQEAYTPYCALRHGTREAYTPVF